MEFLQIILHDIVPFFFVHAQFSGGVDVVDFLLPHIMTWAAVVAAVFG